MVFLIAHCYFILLVLDSQLRTCLKLILSLIWVSLFAGLRLFFGTYLPGMRRKMSLARLWDPSHINWKTKFKHVLSVSKSSRQLAVEKTLLFNACCLQRSEPEKWIKNEDSIRPASFRRLYYTLHFVHFIATLFFGATVTGPLSDLPRHRSIRPVVPLGAYPDKISQSFHFRTGKKGRRSS